MPSLPGRVRILLRRFRYKYILVLLVISFLFAMILGIKIITSSHDVHSTPVSHDDIGTVSRNGIHLPRAQDEGSPREQSLVLEQLQQREEMQDRVEANIRQKRTPRPLLRVPIAANGQKNGLSNSKYEHDIHKASRASSNDSLPNYDVHVFYYAWYGSPGKDELYLHWNHRYLPHWEKKEAAKWPKGRHEPPDDIGSNFYPELGPYSSRDPRVVENHMQQIRAAGIGVLALSWYPPGLADEEGRPADDIVPLLLDSAERHQLKICFHIEPFKERNATTMITALKYITENYSSHPAFYKRRYKDKQLPLYYIYDSYLIPKEQWSSMFRPDGSLTVRNSQIDAIFIGLIVHEDHKLELLHSGFDGYYTYFASDGFTYGSSTRNWLQLANYAKANEVFFIPSVGPGYVDTRIRPWNLHNTKDREQGGFYEQSFKNAVATKPPIITITSFNEWGEGTQIEKAVPKEENGFKYLDYAPQESNYYLTMTKKWVQRYRRILE